MIFGLRLALLAMMLLSGSAVRSEPLRLHLGMGYEDSSSPLIRVSDDGALIFVDGLMRLAGSYANFAVDGMSDREAALDGRLSLSGRFEWKHSEQAPDLDFGQGLVDLTWHIPSRLGSLGLGTSIQRMWVAGGRFRDVLGFHADWTQAEPDGSHWIMLLDAARNRHPDEYADLDSQVWGISLHRHAVKPIPGVAALDLEAGLSRERNAHGYQDLSSHSGFMRIGVDQEWRGLTFSLGLTGILSRYDEALLDGVPARRDRFVAWDFGFGADYGKGHSWQVEAMLARNRANSDLYDNRYRQIGLNWSLAW